jgi:CelD/BcsL family acetyltransferase involved in cellulose biosynthesis
VTAPRFTTRSVTPDELAARRDDWLRLAAKAIEPNPFYGPDFLLASQAHLRPKRAIDFLVVENREDGSLAALFPLERPHLRDGLFRGARALYRNPFSCLAAPLIRTESAPEILDAALAHLARKADRLLIPMTGVDRGIAALFAARAAEAGLPFVEIDRRIRPAVETGLTPEAYRAAFWKKEVRASERRRLRRLDERGNVTWRRIASNEPGAREALEVFLALEAKGWKGLEGTALAREPTTLAFARAAFLPTDGGVIYEILALDGRPLAVSLTMVSGGVGFALKSAYDEDFAVLGAGTLLDGYSLAMAAGGPLQRLDSCAALEHPLGRRWRQEEPIGRYLLSLEPAVRLDRTARWLARIGRYGIWSGFGDR